MSTTINFPDSPSIGDTYTYGDVTYKYDGARWFVDIPSVIPDDSITLAKLNGEFKDTIALAGTAIDWNAGIEFTKGIAANTTFTDSALVQDKVIVLRLNGDYAVTFPAYWDIMKGSEIYDGTVSNTIVAHCLVVTESYVEVEYYINQKEV